MRSTHQQGRIARSRAAVSIAMIAALAGLLAGASSARAQVSAATGPPTMSGDSYLLGVTGPGGTGAPTGGIVLPTLYGLLSGGKLIEAGPLPSGGGSRDAGLLNLILSGNVCTTGILACATVIKEHTDGARPADGTNATATSSGLAADARVFPSGLVAVGDLVRATALTSNTQINCQGLTSPFSVYGHKTQNPDPNSTSIASLTVAGVNIPILGTPNQVVNVLGIATVTLNAQAPFLASQFGSASSVANANGGVNQAASASAAIIDFPATSPLAGIVGTGQIILQHSDSAVSGCAPFTVTKTSNGSTAVSAAAGTDIPFHITATNTSGLTCSLQSITDYLPPQPGEGGVPFTFVSGGPAGAVRTESHPAGGTQNIETFTFSPVPNVVSGGSVAFDLVAHIPSNEPAGTYTQRAAFSSDCGAGSGVFVTGVLTTITVGGGGIGIPRTGAIAGGGLPTTGGPALPAASTGSSPVRFVLPTALLAGLLLGALTVVRRRTRREDANPG